MTSYQSSLPPSIVGPPASRVRGLGWMSEVEDRAAVTGRPHSGSSHAGASADRMKFLPAGRPEGIALASGATSPSRAVGRQPVPVTNLTRFRELRDPRVLRSHEFHHRTFEQIDERPAVNPAQQKRGGHSPPIRARCLGDVRASRVPSSSAGPARPGDEKPRRA
jgi:hypothetical protein